MYSVISKLVGGYTEFTLFVCPCRWHIFRSTTCFLISFPNFICTSFLVPLSGVNWFLRLKRKIIFCVFYFFMPPPLGAGGIMFLGCLSVRPSVAWNTLFWPVHGSVGPPNQQWPFCSMSVRPSVRPSVYPTGEVSGHLPEITGRKWPEILHADVSWPSSKLISLLPWSVDFSNFGTILT